MARAVIAGGRCRCYFSVTRRDWVSATTSLKLPLRLRSRISALAKLSGRSAHSLMLEAIERHATHEERMRTFVKEAAAADRAIERGGDVYAASDVHAWLDRLASRANEPRPKPWRR
jgi:predicted DNA-binding protein